MLKIRLGRAGGLEAALQALKQGNVDMGVLQETKLKDGIHARQGSEYAVWETDAESRHWGGITGSLEGGHGVAGGGHG